MTEDPVERVLYCPHCKRQHLDARWYRWKNHKTHHCRYKDCKKTFESEEACVGVKSPEQMHHDLQKTAGGTP